MVGGKTSSRRQSISEIKLGPEFAGAATADFAAAVAKVVAIHPHPDDDDPPTGVDALLQQWRYRFHIHRDRMSTRIRIYTANSPNN